MMILLLNFSQGNDIWHLTFSFSKFYKIDFLYLSLNSQSYLKFNIRWNLTRNKYNINIVYLENRIKHVFLFIYFFTFALFFWSVIWFNQNQKKLITLLIILFLYIVVRLPASSEDAKNFFNENLTRTLFLLFFFFILYSNKFLFFLFVLLFRCTNKYWLKKNLCLRFALLFLYSSFFFVFFFVFVFFF